MINILMFRIVYLYTSITRYPIVLITISVFLTIYIYNIYEILYLYLTILTWIILLIFLNNNKIKICIIFTITIVIFIISLNVINQKKNISNFYDKEIYLKAKVVSYPYDTGLEQVVILRPILVKDNDLIINDVYGNIRIKLFKSVQLYRGQIIEINALIEEPPVFENFNYKEYLKSIGVYALAKDIEIISSFDVHSNINVEQIISKIKYDIIYKIRKYYSEPHAGLLLGILIGTREEFPGNFEENLSTTGTTHIIAVSGYNVTVIIGLILQLAGIIPRRIAIIFAYIVLVFFLLLVGTDNLPALRASIMGGFTLLGMVLGRRSIAISMLMLSALLMLITNIHIYQSLSFQLSFLATIGLIFISDHLNIGLFIGNIADELAVTMAAILITFPITFGKFGKVTLWAPLSNILVGPLVPIIMYIGFINLITMYINHNLAMFISYYVKFFLDIMIAIINNISTWPLADIKFTSNYTNLITNIYILLLFIFTLEMNYKKSHAKNSN
jgi:competence protein ComEC